MFLDGFIFVDPTWHSNTSVGVKKRTTKLWLVNRQTSDHVAHEMISLLLESSVLYKIWSHGNFEKVLSMRTERGASWNT